MSDAAETVQRVPQDCEGGRHVADEELSRAPPKVRAHRRTGRQVEGKHKARQDRRHEAGKQDKTGRDEQ